uniref:Uncharacterized protein n=1 Tax=viral metagenome TaxID=1070528 RepID=A0A6M3J2F9_9ZZZZ
MPAKETKEITIPIKTVSRLLPVILTDDDLRNKGGELASTVQEINGEEDKQKEIKDQLKARMSQLVAKQSTLANTISNKKEYQDVQVKIEMHASGQVSETRVDTGEVIVLREAYEDEKQLSLSQIPEEGE